MSASNDDSAGDLLIQEVNEELRHDQYRLLGQKYGIWFVAAAVAVILAVAGWQGWQHWQGQLRQQEAARLSAAEALVAEGKLKDAAQALDALAAQSRTGYAVVAQMREGEVLAQSGDPAGARAAYDKLASSSAPVLYRDLATFKGALLAADQGDPATAETKLNGLTAVANPWHYAATEALAAVAQQRGDLKRAGELYKQLADDLAAPQGVRARAAEMLAALGPADKAKG